MDKFSTVIRQAVEDAKAQVASGYKLDMDIWFFAGSQHCSVCLGGAWLVARSEGKIIDERSWNKLYHKRPGVMKNLGALDKLRKGAMKYAFYAYYEEASNDNLLYKESSERLSRFSGPVVAADQESFFAEILLRADLIEAWENNYLEPTNTAG